MKTLDDLQTPAFLIEIDTVERNCERMLHRADEWSIELRPHVKTHKIPQIARLQLGRDTGPITVSTLAEADLFAEAGFEDITWAVPLDPRKAKRAARISRRLERLIVLIDSARSIEALVSVADASTRLEAMIKIDCGYHRAGLAPDDPQVIDLVHSIEKTPHVNFAGLLTHAGHSYHASDRAEIRKIAREEVRALQVAAETISDSGLDPRILSVGSTPTAAAGDLHGADEMRPGNYTYFDAFQHRLGVCELADCAVSVLTTVLGSYPNRGKLILDAGALALSKDSGMEGHGYGIVCTASLDRIEGLRIESLSQEHGEVSGAARDISSLRPGDRVRIVPNHSCLTAAQFSRHWVVRDGEILESWVPAREW